MDGSSDLRLLDPAAQRAREKLDDRSRMLTFMVMALGMFMALLDIQIVASSLSEIQGGLAATSSEIAFIQTSYLITEVIMIPLSGWLARLLSTRWLFTLSAAGFTLSSLACGLAWNIQSMVVFRAVQGFLGGAMIPTAFAAGFVLFTGAKQSRIPAILGMVATLAPALGPSIGGVITAHLSWRWLFFINLFPGVLICLVIPRRLDIDRPEPGLLRQFDFIGLITLALFLGCLQYVLEEGPKNGWLDDDLIAALAAVSLFAGIAFFWRSLAAAAPIVDLRALRRRNFALGCGLSFILGAGMYGVIYLTPVYLGAIRGYDALQVGTTVFVVGIFQLLAVPAVVMLSKKIDVRVLLAFGFGLFGLATGLLHQVTAQWGFEQLLLPQALRGFAMMFCIVPITTISLGQLPAAELKSASGLVNLMRNLGGAIGLAVINTQLYYAQMERHLGQLQAALNPARDAALARMDSVTAWVGARMADDDRAALIAQHLLTRATQREALVLSFADVFLMISLAFALGFVLIVAVKRIPLAGQGAIAEH